MLCDATFCRSFSDATLRDINVVAKTITVRNIVRYVRNIVRYVFIKEKGAKDLSLKKSASPHFTKAWTMKRSNTLRRAVFFYKSFAPLFNYDVVAKTITTVRNIVRYVFIKERGAKDLSLKIHPSPFYESLNNETFWYLKNALTRYGTGGFL